MNTLIVRSFNNAPREAKSRQAFDLLKQTYIGIDSTTSWEIVLKMFWDNKADIIIMEHDTVPTVDMAERIVKCPELLCTQAYPLYKGTTGLDHEVMSHRYHVKDDEFRFYGITETPQYCDLAGFGFTKLSYKARMLIGNDWISDWNHLDHQVSVAAFQAGLKFHIHYPFMIHSHTIEKNNV